MLQKHQQLLEKQLSFDRKITSLPIFLIVWQFSNNHLYHLSLVQTCSKERGRQVLLSFFYRFILAPFGIDRWSIV